MTLYWLNWCTALWYANKLALGTGVRRRIYRAETVNGPRWVVGPVQAPRVDLTIGHVNP